MVLVFFIFVFVVEVGEGGDAGVAFAEAGWCAFATPY